MNLQEYASKQLKEKEELVLIVRRHALTLIPGIAFGTVVVAVDFFLLAWWMRWQGWGILSFLFLALIGGLLAARAVYMWLMNAFIITNQRIIDMNQRGFFQRTVSEASYDKMQDVRYTIKGFWRTLLKLGTVEIQTAGSNTNLELSGLKDPHELQQMITDIQQQTRSHPGGEQMSASDLIRVIDALKKTLSPDEFDALLKRAVKPPKS